MVEDAFSASRSALEARRPIRLASPSTRDLLLGTTAPTPHCLQI